MAKSGRKAWQTPEDKVIAKRIHNEKTKEAARLSAINLDDRYIIQLVKSSLKIAYSEVTEDMIKSKRNIIIAQRELQILNDDLAKEGLRLCSKCSEIKPFETFRSEKRRKACYVCLKCNAAAQRANYAASPEIQEKHKLAAKMHVIQNPQMYRDAANRRTAELSHNYITQRLTENKLQDTEESRDLMKSIILIKRFRKQYKPKNHE